MSEAKTMYAAEFKYNTPRLARLTIEKSTPKTIVISECESLLGHQYLKGRQKKQGLILFFNASDAEDWLIEQMQNRAQELRKQADKLETLVLELERARQKADDDRP